MGFIAKPYLNGREKRMNLVQVTMIYKNRVNQNRHNVHHLDHLLKEMIKRRHSFSLEVITLLGLDVTTFVIGMRNNTRTELKVRLTRIRRDGIQLETNT